MTTKDKTGDQLMASIRKAKTEGATSEKEPAGAPQAAAATPKAAASKAAAPKTKPAARRPPVTKKKVAAKPRPSQPGRNDEPAVYQSPGRVWPD